MSYRVKYCCFPLCWLFLHAIQSILTVCLVVPHILCRGWLFYVEYGIMWHVCPTGGFPKHPMCSFPLVCKLFDVLADCLVLCMHFSEDERFYVCPPCWALAPLGFASPPVPFIAFCRCKMLDFRTFLRFSVFRRFEHSPWLQEGQF